MTSQVNLQWKLTLIEEVKQHMPGIMLYGIKLDNTSKAKTRESFENFCKGKLGMREEEVSKLSIGDIRFFGSKNPPVLVKLGSAQERNELLRLSHKLSKGESLDKYVPKRYEVER